MEADIIAKVSSENSERGIEMKDYVNIGSNGEIKEIERDDNQNCGENKVWERRER